MAAVMDNNKKNQTNSEMRELSESDLTTLRRLLMGPDYEKLLQHKVTLENPELLAKYISPVVSEALKLRSRQDASLQQTLNPIVTEALLDSVSKDPRPIADALYPIMGPAIRKSINSTMNQMMSNFNELLEQSISPRSWQWRFDAWRTGRSYSEVVLMNNLVFQVEQVFLISRETGLLLQHVLADTAISKDPDMVSGMLTAIQDFTSDSFSIEENSSLNSLKLGDLTVLIEQGPSATLATVVRGAVPQGMQQILTETLENIHHQEAQNLQNYDGNPKHFEHLQPLLANCLRMKQKNREVESQKNTNKHKKVIWFALPLLMLGLAYLIYNSMQKQHNWNEIQARLNDEPGLIVIQTLKQDGKYKISGLIDPLANKPSNILTSDIVNSLPLEFSFKPYLSLEPIIILSRIKKALLVPKSVDLRLNDEVLYATGHASPDWIKQFRLRVPLFAGIKTVNLNQLKPNIK